MEVSLAFPGVGDRVKIAAWTDLFMMGERYAKVVVVRGSRVRVCGERSGRKFWLGRDDVEHP